MKAKPNLKQDGRHSAPFLIIPLLFGCFLIAGCAIYKTVDSTATGDSIQGQPYFLPKGLIHIVIKDSTTPQAAKPASTGTTSQGATATVSVTASATASGAAASTPSSDTTPKDATTTRSVTVEAIIVPDPSGGPYFAHYTPNAIQDDTVDVGVNSQQLLQTAGATTTDETATVISNLVQTFVNGAEVLAAHGLPSQPTKAPANPLDIDVSLDPQEDNTALLRQLNSELEPAHVSITLSGTNSPSDPDQASQREKPSRANGLWFRQLKGYEVVVTQNSGTNSFKRNVFSVVLPDKKAPFCFCISRGAFIKKVTTLTVSNGILQGIHIDKPSEIAGATKILSDTSQQIASLPKDLIGVKVTYLQSENSLLQQQADLLNAQAALIKAQQNLSATQTAAAEPATSPAKP